MLHHMRAKHIKNKFIKTCITNERIIPFTSIFDEKISVAYFFPYYVS